MGLLSCFHTEAFQMKRLESTEYNALHFVGFRERTELWAFRLRLPTWDVVWNYHYSRIWRFCTIGTRASCYTRSRGSCTSHFVLDLPHGLLLGFHSSISYSFPIFLVLSTCLALLHVRDLTAVVYYMTCASHKIPSYVIVNLRIFFVLVKYKYLVYLLFIQF
jgi:hypothetical protein